MTIYKAPYVSKVTTRAPCLQLYWMGRVGQSVTRMNQFMLFIFTELVF